MPPTTITIFKIPVVMFVRRFALATNAWYKKIRRLGMIINIISSNNAHGSTLTPFTNNHKQNESSAINGTM